MATFLSKLFKPKWQSKNFETRKQAIELLDGYNADDLKVLIQLAENDPATEIKQLAIQKINDADTLISLHKKVKDELKSILEQRLYELATAQSLSIFDLIIDLDLLTEMIIKSNQSESYIRGLARVENPKALYKIATQSRNAQIRQAAAELIETEKELSDLFTHAKNKDKTVYHIAKNKLSEIRAHAQHEKELQERIAKLLKDILNLSCTEALQHYDARLAHLNNQWTDISSHINDAQSSQYSELYAACLQKLEAHNKERVIQTENKNVTTAGESAENASENKDTDSQNEIDATLSTIKDTLNRFQQQAANTLEISALDALIKTQENRWLEATRETDVNKLHQKTYLDGMMQLRHYLKSMRVLSDQNETLNTLIGSLSSANTSTSEDQEKNLSPSELEKTRKQVKATIKAIDWPNHFAAPNVLLDAQNVLELSNEKKLALIEQQKQIEAKINQQIGKMDLALEDKQIKTAVQHLKEIQSNLTKLEVKQADRFQQGLALRINQLNELRDWQGYASTPKQEELCIAMERLADLHIDPNDKADKIKAMQKEWKSLGGTGNQDLWNRFKTAADKAFEPCALFFAEQKQLKQNNLTKREMLLTQLKEYTSSIDWDKVSSLQVNPGWNTSDWKTADKINRQARQEWKDAFPVDLKANKTIQTEFYQLMDAFDQHLEKEKSYNLSLKKDIVEKAQALTEAEDTDASIQAIKALQEAWQKIGITDHKSDRKLWAQYRNHCDAVFAKRDQQRQTKRSELDQAIQTANAICETLEASSLNLNTKSDEELKGLITEHRKQTQSLPSLPSKIQEKITHRIEAITNTVKDEIKLRDKKQKRDAWIEVARKSEILKQAYAESKGEPLNPERLAELDQLFTSNTVLPNSLEEKFTKLWNSLQEGNTQSFQIIDTNQAREICIACEIAAGLDSPETDKAHRMQLQVSRLSEGLSSGNENLSREAQLENAMTNWYLSLGTDDTDLSQFESRIAATRDKLLA